MSGVGVKEVLVCDEGGEEEGVATFIITYPDGTAWSVDLCEVHSKELTSLREKGHGKPVPRTRTGRQRQTMKRTRLTDLV